jgi:succinoglycan biosynthesis transport protein ExoP
MPRPDDQLIRRPLEDPWDAPREETWLDGGISGILHYVLQVLTERWLTILATLALCALALGAYIVLVPQRRLFDAHVQMLVEPEGRPPLTDASSPAGDPSAGYYETQQRILRSRTLARRTLASLKPATAADQISAGAVDNFLLSLSVSRISNTSLLEVRFLASDPAYAAAVANAHTQAYVRQSVEATLLASREASNWLMQPLEDQRKRVEAGEAELKRFQREYGHLDDRQALLTQRLSELNAAVLRARAQRTSKETAHRLLQDATRSGKPLHELAALIPSSMVQQISVELASLQRRDAELSAQYGPRHPERIKTSEAIAFTTTRLDAEVARAVDASARELAAARDEEQRAVGALEGQTAESAAWSRRALDYDALKREAASDRTLYEKLEQRARQLHLASGYELSNIRVIDPAEVPSSPLSDNRRRNLMMASAASLLLSLVLAFGVHYFDGRLRSPEDVRTHLGLPYLGMVPKLPRTMPPGAGGEFAVMPPPFHEAIRDLRTHVLCTPAGQEARILLVASASVDEGKTLVATALAAGLAQVVHPVLLIDLDLRQPSLHRTFGVPAAPGLTELFHGLASAREAIRPTKVPGLWVLTAGAADARNPGDLLGSGMFRPLMEHLPKYFNRIVLDSPPVMLFTDASLVAHEQAGVVFVVSADRTGRLAARAALDRLEAVGARFVGAVINRADLSQAGSAFYPRYSDYARAKRG